MPAPRFVSLAARHAAALAVTLLGLFAASCTTHPTGLPVRIARARPCKGGDVRNVVLEVHPHGRVTIDSEELGSGDLTLRLQEIFRSRYYRFAYLKAAPGVQFSEVVRIIDQASVGLDHVVLVTPALEQQARWLGNWRQGDCIDPNLPPDYLVNPFLR
jgi:biopolymer transport protein ExbD